MFLQWVHKLLLSCSVQSKQRKPLLARIVIFSYMLVLELQLIWLFVTFACWSMVLFLVKIVFVKSLHLHPQRLFLKALFKVFTKYGFLTDWITYQVFFHAGQLLVENC